MTNDQKTVTVSDLGKALAIMGEELEHIQRQRARLNCQEAELIKAIKATAITMEKEVHVYIKPTPHHR